MGHLPLFLVLSLIFCFQIDKILAQCSCSHQRCIRPNEEYDLDPKRAQNTCDNYGCYEQFACPGTSETGDCYCKKGYARWFQNGPCISIDNPLCKRRLPPTPDDCAKKENEMFYEYASQRTCENTCKNYRRNCVREHQLIPYWQPHCDCEVGYARLPNGKCVDAQSYECVRLYDTAAETKCGKNEMFAIRPICDSIPTCEEPNGPKNVCLAVGYSGACICRNGYIRNSENVCIPKNEC